jgi:prepilin-type processing-associated H-X9-DG protein
MEIPGSHGKLGRFNATFMDGHAATVACHKKGSMYMPSNFSHVSVRWRQCWRSPEWQYDNFPRRPIKRALQQWTMFDQLMEGDGPP